MKWRYCIKLLVCRFPFLCYEYKLIDKQKLSERDSSDSKNSTVVTVNGAHKQYLANPWKCLVYDDDSRCDSNWNRIKLLSTFQGYCQRNVSRFAGLNFCRVSLAKAFQKPTQAIC